MEPNLLIEYRCVCGKLLFKGLLLLSIIEVKCKRCGETRIFRDDRRGIRSFMLVVDGRGRVVDACAGIVALECSRQYVIGKLLFDILPLARDAPYQEIIKTRPASNRAYQIRNNMLLLHDRKVTLESHIVPIDSPETERARYGAGKNRLLYHVFNLIKEV